MAATINGIPVYEALVTDEDTGMLKVSLVDDPAVMSNFLAFDANKQMVMYAVTDEEKRIVRGILMRCDFPIFRRDANGYEYYITYKADTIRQMAEKYLADGNANNVNLMHEKGSDVEGVQMVQYFIKDSANGVNPAGFEDMADGSLFAEYHITNDEVWDKVKDGTYKGFSLEGVFELQREEDQEEVDSIVDRLNGLFNRVKHSKFNSMGKLKQALQKLLAEFGNVTTDKAILVWDGDDDLKEGDAVFVEDSEGNRTPAPDDDYKTADNKVIKVVDGKVSEITDAEAEVAPTEENFGSKATDKGELSWEGEGELKEGDAVYVIGEDGERTAAPDGDYKTEDGKTIKVADGKVAEIVDTEAEVAPEEELKAKRQSFFSKVKALFSESYEEKTNKIREAIKAFGMANFYIYECSDDYAIICYWGEDYSDHYKRFDITFDADGNAVASNPVDVVREFVPDGDQTPAPTPSTEEFSKVTKEKENLAAENEALKARVAELEKLSGAKPAEEEVETEVELKKTGDPGLDRLAKYASARSRK